MPDTFGQSKKKKKQISIFLTEKSDLHWMYAKEKEDCHYVLNNQNQI